jgi:hypothetical protein
MAGGRAEWAATGRLPEGIIYPELVHLGMVETLAQNADAFNAASMNTLRLVTRALQGDFAQESFFKEISGLVSRRNVASGSPGNEAATVLEMSVDEFISVKLNRKIGPVDQTLDSFRKLGMDADFEVISFMLGEQVAKAVQVDSLNTGLRCVTAALLGQANLNIDIGGAVSPQRTITTNDLVDTLALFGDAASKIRMWVMHSKVYYDLVKSQITANIDGVSDFNVASATPVTLNRPVLVTDSAALVNTSSPNALTEYVTLGLVEDAVVLEESEDALVHTDIITGNENIVARMQGEYAFNVGLKGFKWDTSNGGVNPADAALATGTNWDKAATDDKNLSGVAIQSL